MERAPIEKALRDCFAGSSSNLVAAYLFGSAARGEARPDSDIDVAVLYHQVPEDPFAAVGADLAAELAIELGRDVDVVVMNRAPVDLIHRILADGVLIREADRSARIAFEVRARREYFDLAATLRRYRRLEETAR